MCFNPDVATFTEKICILHDHFTRILIRAGEECDGIYLFRGAVGIQAHAVSSRVCGRELWHRRLGYPSSSLLNHLSGVVDLRGSRHDTQYLCDVCVRAKQPHLSFSESDNKAVAIFDLIYYDIWGPYCTPSKCGSTYFLTIVDDHSRAVWVFLMRAKSEVAILLPYFCALAERQFYKSVRVIRSDNGAEFMGLKSYFGSQGIIHQNSCVGTPQQNGRVERKHRHILNIARSLHFQANLPIEFWGDCVLTAAYLINRTLSTILAGKTSYEILFDKQPNYDLIRVFGCLCYAHKGTGLQDKFDNEAHVVFFLDTLMVKKAGEFTIWKLRSIMSLAMLFSKNIYFHFFLIYHLLRRQINPCQLLSHLTMMMCL